MPLNALQVVEIGAVLLAAAFIQGAVGFAFAVFAVPALTLLGLPVQGAIAIASGAGLVQTSWSCRQLREHVLWHETVRVVAVRCAFMGLGIWLLANALAPNPAMAKRTLGAVLLAVVTTMWALKVRPRERLHPIWGAIAFPASGLMGGMFGMGGPALVLWTSAHEWTNHRMRAFLLANFLAVAPIQIALLILAFGWPAARNVMIGAAFGPFVVPGAHLGLYAGSHLSSARLRSLALGVLVVMALVAIAAPKL